MKKVFPLFLLLFAGKIFAQPCKDTRHTPTAGQGIKINPTGIMLDEGKAQIAAYRNLKNPSDASGKKKNIDYISYDPCGFLAMLKLLTSNRNYTGLRIYIAADASNKLTLIFSPTEQDWVEGDEVDKDDETQYWEIDGKIIKYDTKQDASNAVKRFQDGQMKEFNNDGKNYYRNNQRHRQNPNFNETTQLWYDISQFNSPIHTYGDYTEAGLQPYLQYLINGDAIDSVVLNFAAFVPNEAPFKYDYQLDLVFDFYKKSPPESYAFLLPALNHVFLIAPDYHPFKRITKRVNNKLVEALGAGSGTNTGVPCPPPPSGQQCPGSLPL